MKKIRVLAAGTFDGIHPGHVSYLTQARALGDDLFVIVARDKQSQLRKGRLPKRNETDRLAAVAALPVVTSAVLGDDTGDFLKPVVQIAPDVLALGYDQWPNEAALAAQLQLRGLMPKIVRLEPFEADRYHSSILAKNEKEGNE